jgi:hypothetical protein
MGIIVPAAKRIPKDNGHWLFPSTMGGKDKVGFIYIVRDNYLKRFYLGKKNYRAMRGAHKGDESNWRRYMSSSKGLKAMLLERPKEEFDFICIEEYKTAGTLSYSETWSLCLVEAPTTPYWYNQLIGKVSWKVKEKISDRHKARMESVINMADFNKERY